MCHDQFVEQMNIGVAKIRKILVSKIEKLVFHAEYARGELHVEICCFCFNSGKTSVNLIVVSIDCRRQIYP